MHFQDDTSSPIPYMDRIDTEVVTDKGAYYGLVVAKPLPGDAESQKRLLAKLEAYFGHIQAERERWKEKNGTTMEAVVDVGIHPASASVVFELLRRCEPWAEENSVELRVTTNLECFLS